MPSRRRFLSAAAGVPAAAIAAGRVVFDPRVAAAAGQAPQAGAAETTPQARALFDAMKAMLGREYTADEEQRVMRRLEGAVRQHEQMNRAGLQNGDEPVTVFNPVTDAMMTPRVRAAARPRTRAGKGATR
ncbi:MAG: hypothetical protein ACM3SQ_04160 [Betaproteobacteria bacterium]